jgi:hypothetical protein
MAKTIKKTDDCTVSKTMASTTKYEPLVDTSKPSRPQTSGKALVGGGTNMASSLTHKQIEERAKAIWRQKGCPAGQDERNWYEAEAQLKRELGIV